MPARPFEQTVDVETPELVVLTYSLAGIGSRVLAGLTDLFICIGTLFAIAVAVVMLGGRISLASDLTASWGTALLILAQFGILWCYYVLFEGLMDGQTPGKRLHRLPVHQPLEEHVVAPEDDELREDEESRPPTRRQVGRERDATAEHHHCDGDGEQSPDADEEIRESGQHARPNARQRVGQHDQLGRFDVDGLFEWACGHESRFGRCRSFALLRTTNTSSCRGCSRTSGQLSLAHASSIATGVARRGSCRRPSGWPHRARLFGAGRIHHRRQRGRARVDGRQGGRTSPLRRCGRQDEALARGGRRCAARRLPVHPCLLYTSPSPRD